MFGLSSLFTPSTPLDGKSLLPGKQAVMYENLLSEMDSYGPFFPQSVLVDYELAFRSAVLKVWPGTTLHYKQALFRHLQAEGLAADYMVSDSPIRTSFSTLGAMPYVAEEDIELAWKELKLTLPPEMTSFVDTTRQPR